MKILLKTKQAIDKITDKTGKYISWLTTILVLLVCYDVAARYIFKFSSVAVQELEWHIFAAIFLLGASYTLKTNQHVRVDLVYSRLTPKKQAFIDLAGTLVFLIPFCIIIIISSENFVINSFIMGESSPDPGGLPARYIIKAILPISFFLLLIQGFSLLINSIFVLLEKPMEVN